MVLPFRNIRDVLGLHAKVSSQKKFFISVDAKGKRRELTYLEFTGRTHQVANLLYDDLKIQRGDTVALCAGNNEDSALVLMACWVVGAVVVLLSPDDNAKNITQTLQASHAKYVFTSSKAVKTIEKAAKKTDISGIIQLDGKTHDGILDFQEAVANRPTTFLGDDSGAKGADIPLKAGDARTATLQDAALWLDTETSLNQYQLLATAISLAQSQAFTGNQHLLGVLPLHRVEGVVANVLLPLVTGATVILMETFDAKMFWELVVNEKAHLTIATGDNLRSLLDFAKNNQSAGDTIFSQGIDRHQMKHFRHFVSLHHGLTAELACEFEDTFGLPIISTYGTAQTAGFATALPITLSWDDHQFLLHGMSNLCVGCALTGNELNINTSNWGETMPITVNGQATGDNGYYQQSDDGRAYLFLQKD
jgi:long-chain acyl-CoA synthetase